MLDEPLFFNIGHVRFIPARRVDDYQAERLYPSVGYAEPTAFAAKLKEPWAE